LLLELKDCNRELLSDLDFLRNTLLSAAREAGATIMGDSFHVFEPYGGVSGVVIIAESHLSIHTWPEYGYAAVDIFTCGDSLHPELAVDLLANALEAKNTSTLELKRGILDSEDEPWR
jgi:S-adenosylmethionine decarboxylase